MLLFTMLTWKNTYLLKVVLAAPLPFKYYFFQATIQHENLTISTVSELHAFIFSEPLWLLYRKKKKLALFLCLIEWSRYLSIQVSHLRICYSQTISYIFLLFLRKVIGKLLKLQCCNTISALALKTSFLQRFSYDKVLFNYLHSIPSTAPSLINCY